MKRNLELIIKILEHLEENSTKIQVDLDKPDSVIEGYSPEEVGYHCYVAEAYGLVKGRSLKTNFEKITDLEIYNASCLTMEGHNLLDTRRDLGSDLINRLIHWVPESDIENNSEEITESEFLLLKNNC